MHEDQWQVRKMLHADDRDDDEEDSGRDRSRMGYKMEVVSRKRQEPVDGRYNDYKISLLGHKKSDKSY